MNRLQWSFVNIAANGRRESVLQFFCIAANDGFDDWPRTQSYQITLFGPIGADV